MSWYTKVKYHLAMGQFWINMEKLALRMPGRLYRKPHLFAAKMYENHGIKIKKILSEL